MVSLVLIQVAPWFNLVAVSPLSEKIVITAAITGGVHTPSMSPYLPITPEQIAEEAVKAAEAGAAIVHIHVREPATGKPTSDIELFRLVLTEIKRRSDVIVNTTTGGSFGMTVHERLAVVPTFRPEMASFNMGSMNFGIYPLLSKPREWKHSWEEPYIRATKDYVFRNTFAEMETFCSTMRENETKPELECYDISHIYNANRLLMEGKLSSPIHMQFVLGITGGIGASLEDLMMMKETADRLLGVEQYTWSVAAAGRHQFGSCLSAARLGGHVRVGLEDNLFLAKGVYARSNAEQVSKIREMVRESTGRECATPSEVRAALRLKGPDAVKF
jgi:3,5-dioxohexanoate:acetyl-CoA acetone transferase